MSKSDFRFVAYRNDNGTYLHFGDSAEMAKDRAASDHRGVPANLISVVDLGENGWPFVDQPENFSLADALNIGSAVE